jgi:hypothetical protein
MRRSLNQTVMAVALTFGLVLPGMAQTYNGQKLEGRVSYVPVGTTLDAVLTSPIDSAVARAGDLFSAKIYAPLYLNNDLVLPANTTLEGQITSADKGGHAGINGQIGMRLTAAVTPDGVRYPLSAVVQTTQEPGNKLHEDKEGNLHGRSKKASVASGVARTAVWTGAGTLLGIAFAPIVGGAVGAGAIAGVATGGAVGLSSNLWRKGKDVRIQSGTRINFSLDQPMSLSTGIAANSSAYAR